MSSKHYDLAISYSYVDAAIAETLEKALSSVRGRLKIWRDVRTAPGTDRSEDVVDAFRRAKVVLILWSKDSASSPWVEQEAAYALCANRAFGLVLNDFNMATLPSRFRGGESMHVDEALKTPESFLKTLDKIAKRPERSTPERIETTGLPRLAAPLCGRRMQIADLMSGWRDSLPKIVSYVAEGGAGKTALARGFLDEMEQLGWAGADAVFAYSFDGQGAVPGRYGASDSFFCDALRFFDVNPQQFESGRDRAEKLCDILSSRRTLLVLDGLQTLQRHGSAAERAGVAGRLQDEAMRAFLLALARDNKGLCIITSRAPLVDFAAYGEAVVKQARLPGLSISAAAQLMEGVGAPFPKEQLKRLARDHAAAATEVEGEERGCNAFAVTLLGAYLGPRFPGLKSTPEGAEFRDAFDLAADEVIKVRSKAPKEVPDSVLKMLRRYEILFEQLTEAGLKTDSAAPRQPARQLLLLRLMGLFDRPTSWGALKALLKGPPIEGLTEKLEDVTDAMWSSTVAMLGDQGVLLSSEECAAEGPADDHPIDAHPLLRTYFAYRLAQTAPEALRSAHGRLYDFFRLQGLPEAFRSPVACGVLALGAAYPDAPFTQALQRHAEEPLEDQTVRHWPAALRNAKSDELKAAVALVGGEGWEIAFETFRPSDERAMRPLFRAMAHGCAAGRHEECFNEVYGPRIARGARHYAIAELGLYELHLSALSHFFTMPFAKPAEGLSLRRQAALFDIAAVSLRALGRVEEAVAPMRGAVRLFADMEDWDRASKAHSELAELLLALGQFKDADDGLGAVSVAADAVWYADLSGDMFERMARRANHANILHHAGLYAEAVRLFTEAEEFQRGRQQDLPLLYDEPGAYFCDLKLAQGRAGETLARALYCEDRRAANPHSSQVTLGIETLIAGRAAHVAARESQASLTQPIGRLDRALDMLRGLGRGEHIPLGYLARAACRREAGDVLGAQNDLAAAYASAQRGGMRLYDVDIAIESAWQAIVVDDYDRAKRDASYAESEIERGGYGRRRVDTALLWAVLHLSEQELEQAKPHLDRLIQQVREHKLWSQLPEISWLVQTYELSEFAPILATMTQERAAFDASEDAGFDRARRRADALDDDIVDARLADPAFRARLGYAVKRESDRELERLGVVEQREFARAYIVTVERPDGDQGVDAVTPASIPDELVEQMMRDEKFVAMVDHRHEHMGKPELWLLPEAEQREAVRAVLAAIMIAQGGRLALATPEPQPEPVAQLAPAVEDAPDLDAEAETAAAVVEEASEVAAEATVELLDGTSSVSDEAKAHVVRTTAHTRENASASAPEREAKTRPVARAVIRVRRSTSKSDGAPVFEVAKSAAAQKPLKRPPSTPSEAEGRLHSLTDEDRPLDFGPSTAHEPLKIEEADKGIAVKPLFLPPAIDDKDLRDRQRAAQAAEGKNSGFSLGGLLGRRRKKPLRET